MTVPKTDFKDELDRATDKIRKEYARRKRHPKSSPGSAIFISLLEHYGALFRAIEFLPIAERRILDLGCRNGGWLAHCCRRWGARPDKCVGIDLLDDFFEAWHKDHPDLKITLLRAAAHEVGFEDASFDVVHQSVMLSSLTHRPLRERTAAVMWRVLRPGGYLVSYDFWTNPLNPKTIGIRRRELRRLFPQAHLAFERTITVAPPLCRVLSKFNDAWILWLEKLRVMNTHYLVALAKPA